MKQLALVVCNNGLGHLKRSLFLLKLLYDCYPVAFQTHIFVDLRKLKHFQFLIEDFKKRGYKIHFLNIESEVLNYEEEFLGKYKAHLAKTDYFWSDNLLFPLKYRREVFLTGSFLWSEVIRTDKKLKKEKELYLTKRPSMIGNKYFATPLVKENPSFMGVGIYNYFLDQVPSKNQRHVLLSCGKTKEGSHFFKKSLPKIQAGLRRLPQHVQVFVEPEFYPALKESNGIRKAAFTRQMFSSILAAVIRPGMGTVCDVLSKGGRIFSFFEQGNFETVYNSRVLEKFQVGEQFTEIDVALAAGVDYLFDEQKQKRHRAALRKLDFNGLETTVKKMREILN